MEKYISMEEQLRLNAIYAEEHKNDPMSVSRIDDNIWLGDHFSAESKEFVSENNIGLVINLTRNIIILDGVESHRVSMEDHPDDHHLIVSNMPEIVRKVDKAISEGKNILFHCWAGRNRSAFALSGYYMIARKMSMTDAMSFIKSKRPEVFEKLSYIESVLQKLNCPLPVHN